MGVSCPVRVQQWRRWLDYLDGSLSPKHSVFLAPAQSRLGCRNTSGGGHVLGSRRSPNPSVANAGSLCPASIPAPGRGWGCRSGGTGCPPHVFLCQHSRGAGVDSAGRRQMDILAIQFLVVSEVLLVCIFSWLQSQILKRHPGAHT